MKKTKKLIFLLTLLILCFAGCTSKTKVKKERESESETKSESESDTKTKSNTTDQFNASIYLNVNKDMKEDKLKKIEKLFNKLNI